MFASRQRRLGRLFERKTGSEDSSDREVGARRETYEQLFVHVSSQ